MIAEPLQYPNRHTPQSWRDRWVKYVSNRPRPNLPRVNPPQDARATASSRRDSRPADQSPQPHASPSNAQSLIAISPDSTSANQAQGRTRFTKEDDQALLKMIRELHEVAAALGKPVRGLEGNKIFEEMAAKASLNSPNLHPVCVHVLSPTNLILRTIAIQRILGVTGGSGT